MCLHGILHSMANTCHQQSSLCAQLVEDLPGVSLALSLHAPNQVLRQSIVPSARAYKLDKLMAAIDTYREKTGQKVGFCSDVNIPGSVYCASVVHARAFKGTCMHGNICCNIFHSLQEAQDIFVNI